MPDIAQAQHDVRSANEAVQDAERALANEYQKENPDIDSKSQELAEAQAHADTQGSALAAVEAGVVEDVTEDTETVPAPEEEVPAVEVLGGDQDQEVPEGTVAQEPGGPEGEEDSGLEVEDQEDGQSSGAEEEAVRS